MGRTPILKIRETKRSLRIVEQETQAEWASVLLPQYIEQKNARERAATIVRAVNNHDALVKALEYCLREHGGFTIKGECERQARAALAAARQQEG